MKKVGISLDKLYVDHDNGPGHPESPERILVMVDSLQEHDLFDKLVKLEPRDATQKEITMVHQPAHHHRVASTKGHPRVFLDADTSTSAVSFDSAVRAVGGVIQSVESVLKGEVDIAFPLVRPPGHHAESDRAMGFCLFNNIAIGAAYALRNYDIKRILIVDWDLHHGNGTQHVFENSKETLFFSTHQFPYYPGTGALDEVGVDGAEGFTVNVPLNPTMGDLEYNKIFKEILAPIVEQYSPELILVSVGYDTYVDDPLGGMDVTPAGFAQQARFLKEMAEIYCDGKIVYVLEGGYNLEGLWLSTKAVFEEIMDINKTDYGDLALESKADKIIEQVKKTQSKYWKF